MYLASIGTHSESDFWLIDTGASFHITPHREWFSEYEKYNGNVFLGDDSPKKIMGVTEEKSTLSWKEELIG